MPLSGHVPIPHTRLRGGGYFCGHLVVSVTRVADHTLRCQSRIARVDTSRLATPSGTSAGGLKNSGASWRKRCVESEPCGYVAARGADEGARERRGVSRMTERNTFVRSLHDLGLAAWFGGSLAGAVGINGAAADVSDTAQRLRVANAGWARWTPVNLAAIGVHLVGATGLLLANKGRVATQRGVGASTIAKTALTAAALGVTAYSRALGKKLEQAGDVPVEGGTDPSAGTPADVAKAQQQLNVCQWLIPALTGGIAVLNAVHGEQQRPSQQLPGILAKPAQPFGAGQRS
jgi:hypothetical protein